MKQPDGEGLFIFRGIRRTLKAGYIVTTNDICEAREVRNGKAIELAIVFMGRATLYPLSAFDGTFERVELDIKGERAS